MTLYRYGLNRVSGAPQTPKIAAIQKWQKTEKTASIIQAVISSCKSKVMLTAFVAGILPLSVQAQSATDKPLLLPEVVIQSLLQDPTVGQSAALSCQAIFRLGQRRAESRVQLSATLEGERELLSNLEGRISPNELHPLGRSYNENLDNIFDAEIEARYRLYDWGVSDNRIYAEQIRLDEARLDVDIKLAERSRDLTQQLISYRYAQAQAEELRSTLEKIAPHIRSMEAQSEAGSISVAELRSAKLAELDLEIKLQRAEKDLSEEIKGLKDQFGLTFSQADPLLNSFMARRPLLMPALDVLSWSQVRVQDLRIRAEMHELNALEYEQRPIMDGVIESTLFDLTDFESQYQVTGRLEFTMPLYDGGANEARQQSRNWRIRELKAARDDLIRNFNSDSNRLLNDIEKRSEEMAIIDKRLEDLTKRYDSLMALLGNSLVSRLELVRLISEIADTKIEQTRAHWQQENSYLQVIWLSDTLIDILGIPTGENAC